MTPSTERGDLALQAADDPDAAVAMAGFEELKYKALVADNPYIDFDEILVVLTDNIVRKNNYCYLFYHLSKIDFGKFRKNTNQREG